MDIDENYLLNDVSKVDKLKIWLPAVTFENALGLVSHAMANARVVIHREQLPKSLGLSSSMEGKSLKNATTHFKLIITSYYIGNLFEGPSNSLELQQQYFTEHTCTFNLQYFPADTQVNKECNLFIKVS